MSPSDMVPALANRSIGGYVVADPFNAIAQIKKIGRIHTFWATYGVTMRAVHSSRART